MSAPRAALRGGAAVAIVAGAALVIVAIGVRGDFPLSDDWSYAHSSRALCEDGALRFLPWTGASLVLQTWYGAALCRVFGFSFEVLRGSTLVLATLGAIGFSLLLAQAGIAGRARALGIVLFALGPLYVNLAFTFMTDVPFTVAAVWSGYGYVRGLATRQRRWLFAGGVFAAAALLIRQHGIFVAAAAALTVLGARERTWRDRIADVGAAATFPTLVAIGFHVWLFAWHGAPGALEHKLTEAASPSVMGVVNVAFRALTTLGLLLAPLAWAARDDLAARHRRLTIAAGAVLAVLAVLLYLREGATMFYLGNVMYDLGLGASTLRDTLFLGLRPPVELGPPFRVALTVVALLGAGIVVSAGAHAGMHRADPAARFLVVAAALLFLGSLLHTRYYFDRYLLVVVPFAIAAIAATADIHVTRTSIVLAAVLAWYAIAGTHDYLAWNRARYAGLHALSSSGVPVEAIDGGMEFNAWHLAPVIGVWPSNAQVRIGQTPSTKSWWWVVDDRFVASFRPLPGYVVRSTFPYRRWLVPGRGRVVILERDIAHP